ncbi:hypothetical protein DTL42_18410 [Bremerella cremea]|uniref:Uncharacterized protein n=1 Tax=Bremerella cremea TaxID=1031537 RepID=A0A368KMT2_9BACT|nr:hypothetical protein [Bremerella cremea]RCS43960.1 hypothetical protein DTL42_18410 [Bremerella cremea]
MKSSTIVTLSGLALVAYSLIAPWVWGEASRPRPVDPGGPNLLAVFQKADDARQAAADAQAFGLLCQSLADMIEFDGKQAEPQLVSGVQLDNFRTLSRFYQTGGGSYAQRYPALPQVAGDYLQSQLGTDGGKLDSADRARWIAAYRQLAASALYAADSL